MHFIFAFLQEEELLAANDSQCICNHGFWNPSCEYECIGGASNPCFGNGICNSTTGLCHCYDSISQDSENCTICDEGRFGTDCSVAESSVTEDSNGMRYAAAFGPGHFTTFDGSSFTFRREGEHYLMIGSIDLQVRLVPCKQGVYATCINAVGFSSGSGQPVVIHGGYTDEDLEYHVWVNGIVANINSASSIGNNYFITHTSYNHFVIYKSNELTIDIYVRGRYIDIYIQASFAVCNLMGGLLSKCDGSPYNDFILNDGQSLVLERNSLLSLNLENIHALFGPSWKVTTSILDPIYGFGDYKEVEDIENSAAGYCLYFQDSSLTTDSEMFTFTGPDVTVELDLRLGTASPDCSAVLSYVTSSTFGLLLCDGHLAMSIGSEVTWKSGIHLDIDVWYRVAVVWQKSISRIHLYAFQSTSNWFTELYILSESSSSILDPGGILVLGQWRPPQGYSGPYLWSGFTGWLDEIKIWNSFYFSADLLARVGLASDIGDSDLSNYWVLNEGQGSVIFDYKSSITFSMVPDTWNPPNWQFSLSVIKRLHTPSMKEIYDVTWSGVLSEVETHTFCSDIVKSATFDVCEGLGMAKYYAEVCTTDAALYDSTTHSMEAVLAYEAHCISLIDHTLHPAQSFCNEFPGRHFPGWIGPSCDIACISGAGSTLCECFDGYWSTACEFYCAGGGGSFACGGTGVCQLDSGTCDCPMSYAPPSNCSTCETGWIGEDCSLSTANISNIVLPLCSMFGYGHIITYDGLAITLDAPGEYYFTDTGDIEVFVRHVPCPDQAACITAVWLRMERTNLTFQAALTVDGSISLYLNDEEISKTSTILPSGHRLNVSVDSFTVYSNKTTVTVIGHITYLDVQVTTAFDSCKNLPATFISGNCDKNQGNDITGDGNAFVHPASITYDIINGPWAEHINLPDGMDTKFLYELDNRIDSQEITQGGYGLYFKNNSTCQSDLLPGNVFDSDLDVTVEFLFLLHADVPGCLFVYVENEKFFAISVKVTIHIHLSPSLTVDTGIYADVSRWGFISLAYYRETGYCKLTFVSSNNNLTEYSIQCGKGFFVSGSSVTFGTWPSTLSTPYPYKTTFQGYMDEIRIWKRTFDAVAVWQNVYLNIGDDVEDLGALWKFSEGSGQFSTDIINNVHLEFSATLGPFFALSGAPLPPESLTFDFYTQIYSKFPDSNTRDEAYAHCTNVVFEENIVQACTALSMSISEFFMQSCFYDMSKNLDPLVAYITVRSYATYCMDALQLDENPNTELCRNVSGQTETFLALGCTDNFCNFGILDLEKDECVCLKGYWGVICDGVCPGGHESPCNRQGFCDEHTGRCHCHLTWSAESNCTLCADGWSGENCSVALPEPGAAIDNKTCTAFGQGHFITFDGTQFDFKEYGEYQLLNDPGSNTKVHVRIIPCYNHSTCVAAVAFANSSESVIIRAGYTSESQALFWHNSEKTELTTLEQTFGHIIVQQESSLEYMIESIDHIFRIHIRIVDHYLNVIFSTRQILCTYSQGICGSCDSNVTNDVYSPNKGKPLWEILSHSLFTPIYGSTDYNEQENVTGAGYALAYDDAFLQSETLDLDISDKISIEFYFKTEHNHGALLSIGSTVTFSLYLNGSLHIAIGTSFIDTGLIPFSGWNHLVFGITPSNNHLPSAFSLSIYLIDADGLYLTWQGTTDTNPLVSSLYIVLGRWLPGTQTYSPSPILQPFKGLIEEFCIWKDTFPLDDVLARFGLSLLPGSSKLVALWKFDEGHGTIITDLIHHKIFEIKQFSWSINIPLWQFSNAPIILASPGYTLSDPENWADSCVSLFTQMSVTHECESLWIKVDVYLVACARDYAMSNTDYARLSIVLSYSDLCYYTHLSQSIWVAQTLCNSFTSISFPVWYGPTCDSKCYFSPPTFNALSECVCSEGFWGSECKQSCTGGPTSPCNNHGTCSPLTGTCKCMSNWEGTDCSQCRKGWFGSDCSLSANKPPSNSVSRCSMFVNGYITMFDGSALKFPGTDDFVFFSSTDVEIHIRQTPCTGLSSCITAIGIALTSSQVLLIPPSSQANDPLIVVDDVTVSLESKLFIGSSEYFVERVALGEYYIYGPSDFKLSVFTTGAYFNIEMVLSSCTISAGLCGPCQVVGTSCDDSEQICAINAIGFAAYASLYPLSYSLTQLFCASYSISGPSSLIYLQLVSSFASPPIPLLVSAAGYSLSFVGSGITSDPLPSIFPPNTPVTLQMYCKFTSKPGGTLFSVSGDISLAIYIGHGGTFWVHGGSEYFDTGIIAPRNDWLFITFSHSPSSGIFTFYCIQSSGVVYMTTLTLHVNLHFFTPGAVMGIGSWVLPSSGSVVLPNLYFTGIIDNLVIRKETVLTYSEVLVSWKQIYSYTDITVAICLSFDVGKGNIVYDFASCISWYIPWNTPYIPIWAVSDLPLIPKPPLTVFVLIDESTDSSLTNKTISTCNRLIYSGPIHTQCQSLDESAHYHYQACLSISTDSQELSLSLDSTLDFSGECEEVLVLHSPPSQQLCQEFPDHMIWPYAGEDCSIPCFFGTFTDHCICEFGYFGFSCEGVCPGGPNNPCNGHGYCDPASGHCLCEFGWQSETNCTTCSSGFIGADCSIIEVPTSNQTFISEFWPGSITTYGGLKFQFSQSGTYVIAFNYNYNNNWIPSKLSGK